MLNNNIKEELTQRQIDILGIIIREYTETGQPVGSGVIEKKYKLGVCPATIRNEMVLLAKKGYLKKEYFSSGRVPSVKGFRYYLKNLMKEKSLSTVDEVAYKNSIWDERSDSHRLLTQATRTLSRKTGLLSLTVTNLGDIYYAGVSNLLTIQEFLDLTTSRNLFSLLEESNFWARLIDRFTAFNEDVLILLGEEDFRDPMFEACASIFGEFTGDKIKGIIGIVGPKRMAYDILVPQVKHITNLIEQIIKEQKL